MAFLGHVICIRLSPSLRSPQDPRSCSLPYRACPFPDPTNIPWPYFGVSPKPWQGMLSQTLSSRVGGGVSRHESLPCLMRRSTLGSWPWLPLFHLLSGAVLLQSRHGGEDSHCKATQEHRGLPNDCSPSRSRPGFPAGWDLSDQDSSEFPEERSSCSAKAQPPRDAQLTAEPRHFWMSASLRTDSSNLLHFDGLGLSASCQFQTIEK